MRTFSRDDLLGLAGRKSYARGLDYVHRVSGPTIDGNTVRGTVTGTCVYRVELTPTREGLGWDCDCPWAEEGNFCKHCVAVGLVHLYNLEHGVPTPETPDLKSYLRSRDRDELVALLLEAVDASPDLRRRLEIRAASSGETADTASLRVLVDSTLRIGDHDHAEYDHAREYAGRVHGVADELENLLQRGMAGEAEELSRHAIDLLDEHAGVVDDSDGDVGEAAHRFVEIHVDACVKSGRSPEELAEWLLDRQLDETAGVPELLVETYADALGEDGLRHYGEALASARSQRPEGDWTAQFLMTEFARVTDDTDLLVRTYASAPEPVHHAGIVAALDGAGRPDEALEWALRGLAESTGRPDERLVDYTIDAYRAAGRDDEIQRLRWEVFERSPQLRTYQLLRADTPEHEWPAGREQALALLRRSAARRPQPHLPCTLVEVLLADDDAEGAWEAAVEHGCDDRQWLRVAALREISHPADALEVYLPRISAKVALTEPALYPEAAGLALRAYRLYERLGRAEEGREFVDGLRTEHRRKRRFMAELDRVGLGRR
ncbi:SWIM zinc finger domain-containing protein [Nocardiopsis sp. FIRDI 009]|uniref:SWIM zinc finger family protein n=1 Tax=Nocardiopsis sp. FIRDI 009 TaxID=714197 RepID=UPI000E263332|nr:DUF6880 family protein [Nocardiopsis sp. FIRDI 009]